MEKETVFVGLLFKHVIRDEYKVLITLSDEHASYLIKTFRGIQHLNSSSQNNKLTNSKNLYNLPKGTVLKNEIEINHKIVELFNLKEPVLYSN